MKVFSAELFILYKIKFFIAPFDVLKAWVIRVVTSSLSSETNFSHVLFYFLTSVEKWIKAINKHFLTRAPDYRGEKVTIRINKWTNWVKSHLRQKSTKLEKYVRTLNQIKVNWNQRRFCIEWKEAAKQRRERTNKKINIFIDWQVFWGKWCIQKSYFPSCPCLRVFAWREKTTNSKQNEWSSNK